MSQNYAIIQNNINNINCANYKQKENDTLTPHFLLLRLTLRRGMCCPA